MIWNKQESNGRFCTGQFLRIAEFYLHNKYVFALLDSREDYVIIYCADRRQAHGLQLQEFMKNVGCQKF